MLATGLGSCSGPTPAKTDSPNTPLSSVSQTADDVAEEITGMPLDPYRAIASGSADYNREQELSQNNRWEEAIARCMVDQGFEYFPRLRTMEDLEAGEAEQTARSAERRRDGRPVGWGTVEYAKAHGFGIDTLQQDRQLEISDTEDQSDPSLQAEREYLKSLSESELRAWRLALSGDPADLTYDGDGNPIDDRAAQGCQGFATLEIGESSREVLQDKTFSELLSALDDAVPTRENDEGMAILEADWSRCMRESGYEFPDRDGARLAVVTEFNKLQRDTDPEDGQGQSSPLSQEEIDQFFSEREQPIALADATCAESINYDDRLHDIVIAFEQRFVDENRAQLDALELQYGPGVAG